MADDKEQEAPTDRLGQVLAVGSIVAAPDSKSNLLIARIAGISPKTVKLEQLTGASSYGRAPYKYHNQVVVIDSIDETFLYMLGRGL